MSLLDGREVRTIREDLGLMCLIFLIKGRVSPETSVSPMEPVIIAVCSSILLLIPTRRILSSNLSNSEKVFSNSLQVLILES